MTPLLEIFDEKLLPWARDSEKQRIILMGSPPRKSEIPEGVRVSRRIPSGPRELLKHKQIGRAFDSISATWPKDGLIENPGVPILLCVFAGRIDYWAGDMVAHCGEGYFLLIPPGLRHDGEPTPHYHYDPAAPNPDDHCALLWIEGKGRIINISTCFSKGAVHGSEPLTSVHLLNDAASQILDIMMMEAVSHDPDWQPICRDYLRTLLGLLRRDLAHGNILTSSMSPEPADLPIQPIQDPIEQAILYIHRHLREPLTIDRVARHVRLARTQFIQRFREKTGASFTQYLTKLRIEEAKTLLIDSNWDLTRISDVVGLGSAAYFGQLFGKHVGVSPSAFRKNPADKPVTGHTRSQKTDHCKN